MATIKQFIVNEKTYKVQTLGVLDTLYFQAELVTSIGTSLGELADILKKSGGNLGNADMGELGCAIAKIDPEKLKKIQPKVLAQVITPKNEFLNDETSIEQWFGQDENAGDVWGVLIKATGYILGEYLPNFFRDMMKDKNQEVRTEA